MDKPFRHLNIPFNVKPAWKSIVGYDTRADKQNFWVKPRLVLDSQTLEFLMNANIKFYGCNVWSWLPSRSVPVWHTDTGFSVAINYLLDGEAGRTEWIDHSKVVKLKDMIDPEYGTGDTRYNSSKSPDFSESIRLGHPMLIRNDIPHRVNRMGSTSIRWTLRLLLWGNWEEALEKLDKYSVL